MARMTESIRKFIFERMQTDMEYWKVPGAGVAVVEGDEITFCEGFGVKSLDGGESVDKETAFRLASVAKPFVALSVAMAVDEELIEWDKPLKNYIPDFKMFDDYLTDRLTIRDTLCHRTGMPGHDSALGDAKTRAEFVHMVRYLENNYDLRVQLQYNSIMVTVAAYAVECVSGMIWEDFVKTRIFEPLGMENAFFNLTQAYRKVNVAMHYSGGFTGGEIAPYDIEYAINADPDYHWPGSPSGGIVCSTEDLAKFVALHVNGGVYKGKRLVSEANLFEVIKPNMVDDWHEEFPEKVNPCAALGWFTYAYKGTRHVSMSGFFGGQMFMVPKEGLGVIFLQSMATGAGDSVPLYIIDEMMGHEKTDWQQKVIDVFASRMGPPDGEPVRFEADPSIAMAHDPEDYVGVYSHPAYGKYEVKIEGGVLGVNKWGEFSPLEHRGQEVFEALGIDCAFVTVDGMVQKVLVPFEPTIKPIVFERQ